MAEGPDLEGFSRDASRTDVASMIPCSIGCGSRKANRAKTNRNIGGSDTSEGRDILPRHPASRTPTGPRQRGPDTDATALRIRAFP